MAVAKKIVEREHLPSSQVLAALGRVTIRHSLLDTVLRATIKTLAELEHLEANLALQYESSRALRDIAKKLGVKKFGRGSVPVLKLAALLNKCEQLTDQRNAFVHSLWLKESNNQMRLYSTGEVAHAPTAKQLNALSDEMWEVGVKLNTARQRGFLHEAIQESKKPGAVKQIRKGEE